MSVSLAHFQSCQNPAALYHDDGGGSLDVRAADLQEEMAEQRFSVPPDPTKTAATQRTSQRAERAIKQSAMREQLERKESHE